MPDRSPRLLVSVRSVAEAEVALAAGADVIDIKEPARGSLGRANDDTISAVIVTCARRGEARVTIALGELRDAEVDPDAPRRWPSGWWLAKVGFAGEGGRSDWHGRYLAMAGRFPGSTPLIPAAYVDGERAAAPTLEEVLEAAHDAGAPYVLLDTSVKEQGRLLDYLAPGDLAALTRRAARWNIAIAAAGGVDVEHVPALVGAGVALIAVRGAACDESQRTGAISETRVRGLRAAIRAAAPMAAGAHHGLVDQCSA